MKREFLDDLNSGNVQKHWAEKQYSTFFFAALSSIAYKDEKVAMKLLEPLGMKVTFYQQEGAECYVLEDRKKIFVVFRGTEAKSWNDIKADLSFRKTWHRGYGRVHRGFMQEVWKLYDHLANHVFGTNKQVYVSGHSLGGAMAVLYAQACRPRNPPMVYTYGAPKAGTREFARNYELFHCRVVNNNDAVPRVPPTLLWFKHTGWLKYINHYGYIRECTRWQRIKDMFRGHIAAVRKFQFFDSLRDHAIANYVHYTHVHWKESLKNDD